MPLSDLQIAFLTAKFDRERDRFEKMAALVTRHLEASLQDADIPYLITHRIKSGNSLRRKLIRDRAELDFGELESEFAPSVRDLAGVRVLVYRPDDVPDVCFLVAAGFDVRFRKNHGEPDGNNGETQDGPLAGAPPADGYRARHRVVALRDETLSADPALANLRAALCEVQIVTLLDHVWNEPEHDIRYKTPHGQPTPEQSELLAALREQLNVVTPTVRRLMAATERQVAESLTVIDSPEELRRLLEARHGRAMTGDFGRLLALLVGVLRDVTRVEIDSLPLTPSHFDANREKCAAAASAARLATYDDVLLAAYLLWVDYSRDVSDVVRSWRGRPCPLARLVSSLQHGGSSPDEENV
jgi:ppGpp synthetase/RelA/SpoT-type nucleotidyltranferase